MSVTFDKLAYVERLKAGGYTEQQAKTQAEALDSALKESVATQHDIDLLRRDFKIWSLSQGAAIIAILAAIRFFA